jgi:hypothetical protein
VFRVEEENTPKNGLKFGDSKYIVITTPVGCAHRPSTSIGTLCKFRFKLIGMFNLRSNVKLRRFLPIRFHFLLNPTEKITQPTFMGSVLIQ